MRCTSWQNIGLFLICKGYGIYEVNASEESVESCWLVSWFEKAVNLQTAASQLRHEILQIISHQAYIPTNCQWAPICMQTAGGNGLLGPKYASYGAKLIVGWRQNMEVLWLRTPWRRWSHGCTSKVDFGDIRLHKSTNIFCIYGTPRRICRSEVEKLSASVKCIRLAWVLWCLLKTINMF